MTHRPNLDRGLQEEEIFSVGSNVWINTEGIFFGFDANAHANSQGWFGPISADFLEANTIQVDLLLANVVDANLGLFNEMWVNGTFNIVGDNPDVRIDNTGVFVGNSLVNSVVNSSGFFHNGEEVGAGGDASNTNILYVDDNTIVGSNDFTFNTGTLTVGNSTANTTMNANGVFNNGAQIGLPPGFFSIRVAQAADTDHDVTFSPGRARDDTDTKNIVLTTALTKQIDASWAVGDGNGGLDTGSVTTNQFYYLWIIKRSDTGVVDALFSLSETSPTMPANYDIKQRIGWVRTNSSSNILAFTQLPDLKTIYYNTIIMDVNVTNQGTTASIRTLSLPPNSIAHLRIAMGADSAEGDQLIIIQPIFETSATPSENSVPGATLGVTDGFAAGEFSIPLNASSQVRSRGSASGVQFALFSKGATLEAVIP